ncbi:MAG: class I SAM-dependent methyltransferase [Chloroflexota bacterium]|nr:class I SAM-dependent methyltransferase [Chloroflexota bacterium]
MDIRKFNRDTWNRYVEDGNQWTIPVSSEAIAEARAGRWKIYLTPIKPVPLEWFPEINNADVLCLASGGGQQGPLLAATGARVTVFDNSPRQLAQDRYVAERENLELKTIEGDMADLSIFPDQVFDLIVHPISNVFVPDVKPVWHEAYRVLRPGGILLAGFTNPIIYIFDWELLDDEGILDVRYSLPYSDLESLPEDALNRHLDKGGALEFSHTLEDQIGGQLEAGFLLSGFYEDMWNEDNALKDFFPTFIASRAVKPPLT